jgi:hypothetical protein
METINLKPACLFGIPPHGWWETEACQIMKSTTFHWGMIVMPDLDGWICTESISKGVALTRFDYPMAAIYRIKGLDGIVPYDIIRIISKYGDYPYDFGVNFWTAAWYLAKHYLGKVLPVIKNQKFNCVEWVNILAVELGSDSLVPECDYLMPAGLEHSNKLEFQGWLVQ